MENENIENRKTEMPMVILRGLTVVPDTTVHFDIRNPESIEAVEKSLHTDQLVFLVTAREGAEEVTTDTLYDVGVICRVRQLMRMQKNTVRVLIESKERAELCEIVGEAPYYSGLVRRFQEMEEGHLTELEKTAYMSVLTDFLRQSVNTEDRLKQAIAEKLSSIEEVRPLLYALTEYVGLSYTEKQAIIGAIDIHDQIGIFVSIVSNAQKVQKIKDDLLDKTRELVSDNQKEYVLREQMRAIRKELGEEHTSDDATEYQEQLEKLKCSEEVKEHIGKEIKRFANISSMSSESAVLRTYIETLLAYPFGQFLPVSNDLQKAIDVLEADHYGLLKVKERVIDTLAVQMLSEDVKAPIICLVGPPGTGKTSIAKSIARATNRNYQRISLGGVRDEAEIRGHRKTYVGAMPGRIATAITKAKAENPLLLLDEVDKVSKDYKGDTSAALLEVLDSEQNYRFVDHYFEVPIDLSHVLFICTANDASEIPRPLLDRMEVIEVNSYTENEKMHIARLYLVDKQIKKNGLKKKQLKIDDAAILKLIRCYTREAGVRSLERSIGKLCQIAARKIVLGERKSLHVTEKNLEKLMGPLKYREEDKNLKNQVGCVTGLAWTSVGGDTLEIEVNISEGKGVMKLTGNLGDVMKESAEIAYSHVRSILNSEKKAASFGACKPSKNYFDKHDFHIHVPEGATPKDGPSAGITMTTALFSAITKLPVRGDVAMTGEVTLRGRVLPIGGLKEKLLAAKQAGKTNVIVPQKNAPNVEEIDKEILDGLHLIYASDTEEVLRAALVTERKSQ